MLGFKPSTLHSDEEVNIVDRNPGMEQVNQKLFEYYKWNQLFDAAIIVTVPDKSVVFQWREQAEQDRREKGLGAFTKEDLKSFCDRFMPSYDLCMDRLRKEGIHGVDPARTLTFQLSHERTPFIEK